MLAAHLIGRVSALVDRAIGALVRYLFYQAAFLQRCMSPVVVDFVAKVAEWAL